MRGFSAYIVVPTAHRLVGTPCASTLATTVSTCVVTFGQRAFEQT